MSNNKQSSIDKDFVPYKESLALKEVGFGEPCFKMSEHKKVCDEQLKPQGCQLHNLHCGYPDCTIDKSITPIPLPTFSQAFRWFREKHGLNSFVYHYGKDGILDTICFAYNINKNFYASDFRTHEEAELECLKKLIEIVKGGTI